MFTDNNIVMTPEFAITKAKLNLYLSDLAKHFSKTYKKQAKAEIILIGGASVLLNYDFRDSSIDADAIIDADADMQMSINFVRDKHNLPHGWLNQDFKKSSSYTPKLRAVAKFYKSFSYVLDVWTVTAEYLVAMKVMSGRQYKFDLSDIVGILWKEFEIHGQPMSRDVINQAFVDLYGQAAMPNISIRLLDDIYKCDNYERLYTEIRMKEKEAKEIIVEFDLENPKVLKGDTLSSVIEQVRKKKAEMIK
jgi:hypothetical protein